MQWTTRVWAACVKSGILILGEGWVGIPYTGMTRVERGIWISRFFLFCCIFNETSSLVACVVMLFHLFQVAAAPWWLPVQGAHWRKPEGPDSHIQDRYMSQTPPPTSASPSFPHPPTLIWYKSESPITTFTLCLHPTPLTFTCHCPPPYVNLPVVYCSEMFAVLLPFKVAITIVEYEHILYWTEHFDDSLLFLYNLLHKIK